MTTELTPVSGSTPAETTAWLLAALAAMMETPADQLDPGDVLDELALDSLDRLRVLADLSDWIGAELETELLYECATIGELGAAASARASRVRAAAPPTLPMLTLAASFTAEPITEPLEAVLAQAGLPMQLRFSPYDQILQGLLDPSAALRTPGEGGAVILWRLSDWFRHGGRPQRAQIDAALSQFAAALAHLPAGGLLAVCPEREPDARCEQAIDGWLSGLQGVTVLDLRSLAGARFDAARESVGHIPYTPEGYSAIALAVARKLHARLTPDPKVIVLDADNTLWDGVVGEDGPQGIRVSAPFSALQQFMAGQRAAGRLLALASKNSESDVAEVFAAHGEMPLTWDAFSARRINWSPKSHNLREIAAELGVGLDALVFLDDSPVEIAEVRAGAPEVLAVQLPEDQLAIAPFLDALWSFDRSGTLTAEDRSRAAMMEQNVARTALASQAGDLEEFLAALALEVSVDPVGPDDLPRAVQLTQRTNQFNATTIRHDEVSLGRWLAQAGHEALAVRVRDRFGEYGFVGLILLEHEDRRTSVDSFMLSCRVLGRRVEHRMLAAVCDRADASGSASVALRVRTSERNAPLRSFFGAVGVSSASSERDFAVGELRAATESAVLTPHLAAEGRPEVEASVRSSNGARRGEGLERIAQRALSPAGAGAELSRELADRVRPRPDDLGRYVAPQSSWERRLCALWATTLRLERVGVHDDFYDLGATSLDLAELTVRMAEIGVPEGLALGMLPEQTVAALAVAVSGGTGTARPALEQDARLPDDLTFTAAPAQAPERVLLTGATGYVGAFTLAGLMRRTSAHVECHVRADDPAAGFLRIRANLSRYGLWDEAFSQRITARPGDLAAPRLGLSPDDYTTLATGCDTIVHNGATVNFLHPYGRLRAANVEGTIQALRLAQETRPKVFHLISTLGVLMSGGYGDRVLTEDDPLDSSEDLPNGYEQSKWVADRLVREAMARGLSGAIHRLGMLSGLAESGVYHKVDEFLPSFLKGCIQLGAFPDLRTRIEMVPVDFVSDVLSDLIAEPSGLGRVYQMNHPAALPAAQFVATIRAYGYPLRLLPWDAWKRELLALGSGLRSNALAPYADFVRALREEQTYMPEMELTNFLGAVARHGSDCPGQDVLLARYLNHFVSVGFLPAPARTRSL